MTPPSDPGPAPATDAGEAGGASLWRVLPGRRSDRAAELLARLARGRTRDPAVVLGQLLLLASGTVFTLTMPLINPEPLAWLNLAAVSAVVLTALVVSRRLPWERLPRWAPLSMPVTVWSSLAFLGLREDMAVAYVGFWVLSFTVTGLTQGARTNAVLLLPAGVAYVLALGTPDVVFAVRAVVAASVWTLVSQLLVAMTRRQQRLADAMRDAAHTDALTGVANRRGLDRRLAALADGDTVVICDLDHFKALNDRSGHAEGDRVLACFGALLRSGLRDGDHASRYGGEEFALVLPATGRDRAVAVTERLRERWAVLQPGSTFSAGTATLAHGLGADEVVRAADRALYEAKTGGRDRTCSAGTGPEPWRAATIARTLA